MDGLRPLSLPVIARAAAQDGAGLLDYGADPMVDPLARPLAASEQPLVLLVEDSAAQARAYLTYMANLPCRVDHVETGADALEKIRSDLPTLVLLDINLPDGSGIDVLKTLRAEANKTAVVMITSHGSINMAVDAMAAGAIDFLVKPFNQDRLRVTVGNVLERLELTRQVETLKAGASLQRFQGFVGSSPQMQQVFSILTSAAGSMATVFITGESGTGKEVAAETLHRQSPRHRGAFVPINCAAIPTDLMESEIFGHVKGAFTGAIERRKGRFEIANNGTLFL
ncbi:MAG: sigma-54-dependent transcriptional regulator, partial [Rhodospirillaceae bacterium]